MILLDTHQTWFLFSTYTDSSADFNAAQIENSIFNIHEQI